MSLMYKLYIDTLYKLDVLEGRCYNHTLQDMQSCTALLGLVKSSVTIIAATNQLQLSNSLIY